MNNFFEGLKNQMSTFCTRADGLKFKVFKNNAKTKDSFSFLAKYVIFILGIWI